MQEYIKWLENKIEVCLEDKDLQREHWAFCQALKKYRELALTIPVVVGRSEQLACDKEKPFDQQHGSY
jgi:hypothetical protein